MLKIFIFLIDFLGIFLKGIMVCLKLCLVVLEICFWLFGIGWILFVKFILLNIMRFCGSGWFLKLEIKVRIKVKFVLVFVIFMLFIMLINIFWFDICNLLWWCKIVSNSDKWLWFKFIVIWRGLVSIEWLIKVWIFIKSGWVFF